MAKGQAFIGAALLLRRENGHEAVVLHLLCQGIEVTCKGLLLAADYDAYQPKLRSYGHRLDRVADIVLSHFRLKPLPASLRAELVALSTLYSGHRLRYASGYDILVEPSTISSSLVLRRMLVLFRLLRRSRLS